MNQYDLSDAIPQTTVPNDGGSSRVMHEVNQTRQKENLNNKETNKPPAKQPDHVDLSAPIYPGEKSSNSTASTHSEFAQYKPKDDDLKPPPTKGRQEYDLSGNRTTKWDNGAVLKENKAKQTRDLRIPDGAGGYHEQHWGPNEADNYKMDRSIEKISGSEHFRKDVIKAYKELPHEIRKKLDGGGLNIVTAEKMTDGDPNQKGKRHLGFGANEDLDDTSGTYYSKYNTAVLAEHPRSERLGTVEGIVKHEMGHAYDHALKDYANSEEFAAAYKHDVANQKLSAQEKKDLAYYLVKEEDYGRVETFAELFCHKVGCDNDKADMEKYFPQCSELVRKKLKQ